MTVTEEGGKTIDKSFTIGFIPNSVATLTKLQWILGSYPGLVRGLHDYEMWLNKPHGPPSGVCTGQMNPQFSGNNFLTVVVFISVK